MGLFDAFANVLVRVKGDTSDLERALKKANEAEKTTIKTTLEGVKTRNDAYQKWADGLTAVNAALGFTQKGVAFALDAFKEFEQEAAKNGGAQLERAKQFRGALDEMNEAWKQGKIAIGEFVSQLTPAVQLLSGTVRYLTDIGNAIRDLPQVGLGGLFDAVIGENDPGVMTDEEIRQLQHRQGKKDAREKAEDAYDVAQAKARAAGYADYNEMVRLQSNPGGIMAGLNAAIGGAEHLTPEALAVIKALNGGGKKNGGAGGYTLPGSDTPSFGRVQGPASQEWLDEQYARKVAEYQWQHSFDKMGGGQGIEGSIRPSAGYSELNQYEQTMRERADALSAHKTSVLESIFGPVEEFDAYAAKMQLVADATDVMGTAIQSSFDAWVSGSVGFKKASEDMLKSAATGLASQMMAHAIAEGALAFGDLARQNYVGAAAHGVAAAKFTAAAVGIGAIARVANTAGGGSAGAGAGAGGGSVAGYGGGYQPPPQVHNYYVGDSFSDENPHNRRQRVQRDMDLARRESGTTARGVTW